MAVAEKNQVDHAEMEKNSWKFSSLMGEFCMREKKDPADQTGCCGGSIDHGLVFGPDMDSSRWALETLSESGRRELI